MIAQVQYNLRKLKGWLCILITAWIVILIATTGPVFKTLAVISAIETESLTAEQIISSGEALQALGLYSMIFMGIINVTCIIVSAIWIYRASTNAGYNAPDSKRITPRWSVGWFFVPIANLWKPYQAIRHIYNGSTTPRRALNEALPSFFGWWWGCYITSMIIEQIGNRMVVSEDLSTVRNALWMALISAPLSIAAAILWLKIVTLITEMQHGESKAMSATSPDLEV